MDIKNVKNLRSSFVIVDESTKLDLKWSLILSDTEKIDDYFKMFINNATAYANELLQNRKSQDKNGVLFLNEVYNTLGIPPTYWGQIVGWDSTDYIKIELKQGAINPGAMEIYNVLCFPGVHEVLYQLAEDDLYD